MSIRFAAAFAPIHADNAANAHSRTKAEGSGATRGSRPPAWLPAADWSDTLPSCFRSEAFAEDLPEHAPPAGSDGLAAA